MACKFCASEDVVAYIIFPQPMAVIQFAGMTLATMHWDFCRNCRTAVVAGDADELADRALTMFFFRHHELPDPGIKPKLVSYYAEIISGLEGMDE